MAARRGGGASGNGKSQRDAQEELKETSKQVDAFTKTLKGVAGAASSFIQSPLTRNIAQFKSALEGLGTQFLPGAAASVAGSGVLGSAVGAASRFGQKVSAYAGALAEDQGTLGDLAERGIELSPADRQGLEKQTLARKERRAKAEAQVAADYGDKASSEAGDKIYEVLQKILAALEALGLGPSNYDDGRNGMRLGAGSANR